LPSSRFSPHFIFFAPNRPNPPLSITFTAKTSEGLLHLISFGEFVLTNKEKVPLEWRRGPVEAPSDPDVLLNVVFDSYQNDGGTLQAGTSTNFRALVPHTKDVPFRILINYAPPPWAA
jgi:hypothetical protein